MIWELLTGTKDPVLTATNDLTAFDVIYSAVIYIVCAFAVFAFHDAVQRRKARKYGLETVGGKGFGGIFGSAYDMFSVSMLVIFGVAFKKRISLGSDPGRKKSFIISLCGVFWCFVGAAATFCLLQAVYILREDAGIDFVGIFIPWLTALFTVFVLVSVFSVILCVVPNDGGHMLAAIAPYELRDKLLAVPEFVSVFIVLIFSVIFAKTYFSNAVVGKVWDLFEYLWTAVGGLFVK